MLGIDDIIATGLKIIDKVIVSPEAKAEAQQKLLELQQNGELKLEEFTVRREELAVNDRDSARKREMEVKDNTPRQLAFIVTALYATLQLSLLFVVIPDGNRDLLMRALGVLDACLIGVWGYYFGSSSSGRVKDVTIQNMSQKNTQ